MKNSIKTLKTKDGTMIRFAFPDPKGKITKDELINLNGLLIFSESEAECDQLMIGLADQLKIRLTHHIVDQNGQTKF